MTDPRARAATLLAVATLVVAGLAGCASYSGINTHGQSSPAASLPFTCGEFLDLSNAQRKKLYVKKQTWYTSTGAVQSNGISELIAGCRKGDDGFLIDHGAECGPYRKADTAVQANWLAALVKDTSSPLHTAMTPEQMVDACNSLDADTDTLVRASAWFADYPSTISWTTETRLGYKASMGLGVGALETGTPTNYPALGDTSSSSNPVMGASCGYDPATDALIPVYLHARNSGASSSPVINGAYGIEPDAASDQLVTSVEIETLYSDGPKCTTEGSASGPVYSTVQWATSVSPGQDVGSRSVIVIKNYISPRFPKGARSELADWTVFAQSWPGGDDPFVSTTSAQIHLDGSSAG